MSIEQHNLYVGLYIGRVTHEIGENTVSDTWLFSYIQLLRHSWYSIAPSACHVSTYLNKPWVLN